MHSLKSFIIATRGRTGSSALAAAIDQLEGVRCFSELYGPECRACATGLSHSILSKEFTEGGYCQSFVHYVDLMNLNDWWLGIKTNSELTHIGFKVVGSVWSESEDFLPFVKEHMDVIHLTRDPVMQAISGLYAREIGIYNASFSDTRNIRDLQSKKSRPINLDPSEVAMEATYAMNWQASFPMLFHGLRGEFIEVQYEEIFKEQGTSRSINELSRFLQIDKFSLGELRYEQNITDLEAQVLNLKEVIQHVHEQGLDLAQLSKITNL